MSARIGEFAKKFKGDQVSREVWFVGSILLEMSDLKICPYGHSLFFCRGREIRHIQELSFLEKALALGSDVGQCCVRKDFCVPAAWGDYEEQLVTMFCLPYWAHLRRPLLKDVSEIPAAGVTCVSRRRLAVEIKWKRFPRLPTFFLLHVYANLQSSPGMSPSDIFLSGRPMPPSRLGKDSWDNLILGVLYCKMNWDIMVRIEEKNEWGRLRGIAWRRYKILSKIFVLTEADLPNQDKCSKRHASISHPRVQSNGKKFNS